MIFIIMKYPKPINIEELCRFLGMLNFYRDHIPIQRRISSRATQCVSPQCKKERQDAEESTQAFKKYETSISNAVLLAHPSLQAT